MSIQSEIERINNNVQTTLSTIAETGVEVGEGSDALPAAATALANEKAPINHTHTAESIGQLPVITAESADGVAYTATVPWITSLSTGSEFIMIPTANSTATSVTLNVNGLGVKYLRARLTTNNSATTVGPNTTWLIKNKPVTVRYDGTYWETDLYRADMAGAYGTLPIANGGTGAVTAESARAALGAVALPTVDGVADNGTVGQAALSDGNGGLKWGGFTYVESLNTESPENLVNLRDLGTGVYVLYGYFHPYAGSDVSLLFSGALVSVTNKTAGSHVMVLSALNCVVNFLEILVDETVEDGFTFTRTDIKLPDLYNTVSDVVEQMASVAPADHTHTAAEVGARASTWKPTQTEVTVSAAIDYSTVRVRGIALAQDNAISVPNGCLCGVYTVS